MVLLVLCFTIPISVLLPPLPGLAILSLNPSFPERLAVTPPLLLLGLFGLPPLLQGLLLLLRGRLLNEERLMETVTADVALLPIHQFKNDMHSEHIAIRNSQNAVMR